MDVYKKCIGVTQEVFGRDKTWIYTIPIDTYSGQVSLGLNFKEGVHPEKIDKKRIDSFVKQHKLRYYSQKMHLASFVLPQYMLDVLNGE